MPRDNKSALIQKIAQQASIAFKGFNYSADEDNEVFADKLNELISLVSSIRAVDLKIVPRKCKPSSGAEGREEPPVTYMHICESDVFSMGVFLLRTGVSIPLHDHPGMNGMIKVLYGKVNVSSFDKMEDSLTVSPALPCFDPPLAPMQKSSVWRSTLRSVTEYSESSGPCLLTPTRDNLHQIDAVDGPAAFLDILAPPYNPDNGRDCHYYKVLQTVAVDSEEQQEDTKEVYLLEIPEPEDFWCGGESYPGPSVSM